MRALCQKMVAQSLDSHDEIHIPDAALAEDGPLTPIEDRCVGVSAPCRPTSSTKLARPGLRAPTPNDQPNTGSRRIPKRHRRAGLGFTAAHMEPVGASRTEECDLPIG